MSVADGSGPKMKSVGSASMNSKSMHRRHGNSDGSRGRKSFLYPSSALTAVLLLTAALMTTSQLPVFVSAASTTTHTTSTVTVATKLRHDESARFDGVAAAAEDRELRGEPKLEIFHRKASKSSKGSTSTASSSKKKSSSSSKKSSSKKKKDNRRKKKKKKDDKSSDTKPKTKSKSKSDDDDDKEELVKLSIKKSYSDYGDDDDDDDDDKKKSDKDKSDTKSKSSNNKKKKRKKKKSLSKTDVDPSKRLCNTSKERQCRDDCFKSNKCKKGHVLSPCHKKCRYECCDPDAAYESTKEGTNAGDLCRTSEEKLCRIECFEKKKCGEDDEDCQKDCRQDCCSGSGSDDKSKKDSKDSSDDDRHSKKDDGKDADDDDDDKDKDKSKSYKPLKWSGDDIPSACQEEVDKFNSCYEKQYEDGKECYGYNADRELEEVFDVVTRSDKLDYTCGEWYDFFCPIRADTDCCRNRIRNIGRCLGREVFGVGGGGDGDDCDDTCRGYDKDKEDVGKVFDPDTFSTLVGLLTDYDLVGVLSGDDPITVSSREQRLPFVIIL